MIRRASLTLSRSCIVKCLSPQIILLRVVMGREWKNERTLTATQTASLKFVGAGAKSRGDTEAFRETIELGDLPRHGNASGSLSDTHPSTRLEDYYTV